MNNILHKKCFFIEIINRKGIMESLKNNYNNDSLYCPLAYRNVRINVPHTNIKRIDISIGEYVDSLQSIDYKYYDIYLNLISSRININNLVDDEGYEIIPNEVLIKGTTIILACIYITIYYIEVPQYEVKIKYDLCIESTKPTYHFYEIDYLQSVKSLYLTRTIYILFSKDFKITDYINPISSIKFGDYILYKLPILTNDIPYKTEKCLISNSKLILLDQVFISIGGYYNKRYANLKK